MELLEFLQEERGYHKEGKVYHKDGRGYHKEDRGYHKDGRGVRSMRREAGLDELGGEKDGKGNTSGLGRERRGRPEGREGSKEEEEEGSNGEGVQRKKEEGRETSGEEDEVIGKGRSRSATCCIM